jgi:hypothetical protein
VKPNGSASEKKAESADCGRMICRFRLDEDADHGTVTVLEIEA